MNYKNQKIYENWELSKTYIDLYLIASQSVNTIYINQIQMKICKQERM